MGDPERISIERLSSILLMYNYVFLGLFYSTIQRGKKCRFFLLYDKKCKFGKKAMKIENLGLCIRLLPAVLHQICLLM